MLRVAESTRGCLVPEEHVCEMAANSIQSAAVLQSLERDIGFRESDAGLRALVRAGKA